MARLAILAFSAGPLRLAAPVGLSVAVLSLCYGVYLALAYLLGMPLPAGWTTIVVMISLFGGLQLAFIGVVGEYLANVYTEVKRRPRFVVRRAINYEEGAYRRFG